MRDILSPTVVSAGSSRVTRLSHQRVNGSSSNTSNQAARLWTSLPRWMNALKAVALPNSQGLRARLKGLGIVDVANICFLTGLTFWLGNLTALALSLLAEPGAISHLEYLTPSVTRLLAVALLLGIVGFLLWSWLSPRRFGSRRWSVKLPSGPVVLLQIA